MMLIKTLRKSLVRFSVVNNFNRTVSIGREGRSFITSCQVLHGNSWSNLANSTSTNVRYGLAQFSMGTSSIRYHSTVPPPIKIQARMAIRFTCKVCQHVNTKTMSKKAYQEGVVLIQCDGCDNRHLIADNLGWFRDNRVNIEDLAKEAGEKLTKLDPTDPNLAGLFEFTPPDTTTTPPVLPGKKEGEN